jgi:hypothetical protein
MSDAAVRDRANRGVAEARQNLLLHRGLKPGPTPTEMFDSTPPKSLALLACWGAGFLARAAATR